MTFWQAFKKEYGIKKAERIYEVTLKRRSPNFVTLHLPIAAIIAGIQIFLNSMPFLIAGYGITYGAIIKIAIIGAALWAASSSMGSKSQKSQANNGHIVNQHSPLATVAILYGEGKAGGNWVFWGPSGGNNKYFWIVIGWGEGEIEGPDKDFETIPDYVFPNEDASPGLNDLEIGGRYIGATYSRFQIKISATGAPDNMQWREKVGAGAWGAWSAATPITGNWQTLSNGLMFRFGATTGHDLGNNYKYWNFYAGDGIWMGGRLFYHYQNFGPASRNLVTHTFYPGSATQTVDAALQAACPAWDDAMRNTAYSIFKLEYNENAFSQLPDFFITYKGRKVHNIRDGAWPADTPAYSQNAALCTLDFVTTKRFGLGLGTDLIDATSWIATANWTDPSIVTNGGATYTCVVPHTSGAGNEPGAGANWRNYWERKGTGGAAWSGAGVSYTAGFTFDGGLFDRKAFLDNFEDMLLNFRGFIAWSEGVYKLRYYADDSGVMSLTESDVSIDESGFGFTTGGIQERPNKVKIGFTDRTKGFTSNWATAEDKTKIDLDNDPREIEIVLVGTVRLYQAQAIAYYHLKRNAFNRVFKIHGHGRCIQLETGDMVTVTHEFPAWTSKKIRISDMGLNPDGSIDLVQLEEDSSIYGTPPSVVLPFSAPFVPVNPTPTPSSTEVPVVSAVKVDQRQLQVTFATLANPQNCDQFELYGELNAGFTPDTSTYANLLTRGKTTTLKYTLPAAWINTTFYMRARILWKSGEASDFCTEFTKADNIPPTTEDIAFLAHFDGPAPFTTDYTGSLVDLTGHSPSSYTNIIHRPARFGKGVLLAQPSTNYVANPRAHNNATDCVVNYFPALATIARSTVDPYTGTSHFRVTYVDTGYTVCHIGLSSNVANTRRATSPGNKISVQARLRIVSSTCLEDVDLSVGIRWYDAGGGLITTDFPTGIPHGAVGEWRYATYIGTAPALSASYMPVIEMCHGAEPSGTTVFDITDVQCEEHAYITPYMDGSLGGGCLWDGTAHQSSSTRAAISVLKYASGFIPPERGSIICFYTPAASDNSGNTANRNLWDLRDGSSANAPILYIDRTTGNLILYVNGATLMTVALPLVAGNHYMLVYNYDYAADQYSLDVNGVRVVTSTSAQAQPGLGSDLFIGTNKNSLGSCNGMMDDFAVATRPLTADESESMYSSNAPISVISSTLLDKMGPRPSPPTGLLNYAPEDDNNAIDKRKCKVYWDPCVDTGSPPVLYKVEYYKDGIPLRVMRTDWDIAQSATLANLDADTTYWWRVTAKDQRGNVTQEADYVSFASGHETTAPADPTVDTTVKVSSDGFSLQWTKNTESDMKGGGYNLYALESNDPGTAKLLDTIAHPKTSKIVKKGDKLRSGNFNPSYVTHGGTNYGCIKDHTATSATEPGVGASWTTYWAVSATAGGAWGLGTFYYAATDTIAFNRRYYFWLTAVDRYGNESGKTAFTSNEIDRTDYYAVFNFPLKPSLLANKRTAATAGTVQTVTIPSGKVWMLRSFYLLPDAVNSTSIAAGPYALIHTPAAGAVQKSPQYCNGMYLKTGDQIVLTAGAGTGAAWFQAKEFTADDDIRIVDELLCFTGGVNYDYTVPTGKRFALTHATGGSSVNQLKISLDGGMTFYDLMDPSVETWSMSHTLIFPEGTVLRNSTASGVAIFGVEEKVKA